MLELVDDRSPTLGSGRLICVDGPAGSGKTTLSDEIAALTGAPVVHMDNLYEGWDGLPEVRRPARPAAAGRCRATDRAATGAGTGTPTGGRRSWSCRPLPCWSSRASAPGSRSHAGLITALVWVEVPAGLRLQRGLARDGVETAEHLRAWALSEQEHFDRDGTRARADLVVDGTTGSTPAP